MAPTSASRPASNAHRPPALPAFRLHAPMPETPPPAHAELTRWEPAPDAGGDAVLGWREAGQLYFHFPGFARYVFDPAEDACAAAAYAGASAGQLFDTFQRAVVPMLLQMRGTEVLHASAVDTQRGVVAFAARSGTGKSTLAAAFGTSGFGVWADDALAWTLEHGAALSLALPFVLRVGCGPLPYTGPPAGALPAPRRLAAILLMERGAAGGPAALRRIERPAAALVAVLPHAYCFGTREPAANRQLMSHYMELVEAVPCWQLTVPDERERVPATVRMLAERLELRPAAQEEAALAR